MQLQEDGAIIALLKEVRIFEKFLNTERGESTRSANRTAKKIIPIVSCNCVFERYSRGIFTDIGNKEVGNTKAMKSGSQGNRVMSWKCLGGKVW